jgi:hypothetical protein
MNWNIGILKETEKTHFGTVTSWNKGCVTHLNSSSAIVKDAFLDKLYCLLAQLAVKECVFPPVLYLVAFKIEVSNCHIVCCDGCSLSA